MLDKEGVRRGGVIVSGSRGDRVENCLAKETAKGVEVAVVSQEHNNQKQLLDVLTAAIAHTSGQVNNSPLQTSISTESSDLQ